MMPRRVLSTGFFLALALPAQPQATPPACTAASKPFAALIAWVLAEGKPEALPAMILGLPGTGDVAVLQKAYRNPATNLVHAVDVNAADGRCDVVFVIDDIGAVTTWVTDASAAIERTFHLSQGENELVPNDRYVSEYETIKSYFLERTPDRYAQ